MLSIVPQNTRVVLVGASRFPKDPINLPELPAVAANVEDLKRVLTDPQLVGIPDENIIMLLDQPNPHIVTSRVADEARKAVDTFIFYYAGHGIVGRTFRDLYLATQETTHQNAEFGAAISFEMIRRAMAQSTAPKRILILDCCYSGRALVGAMGAEADVQQAQLDLQGTYSIASAPANKAAISPPGERHTAFTGELLKVLDGGLDNGKEELTISDIYDHIRNEFRKRPNLPEPQQSMYQDAGSFRIAYNRKYRPDGYEKQPEAEGEFIGRQREMGKLKGVLEDALSGRGQLLVLVGEPGIGKTRTAQELAAHAETRGIQVLWGWCYEEEGAPSFWPWLQPIRSYIQQRGAEQLQSEMGLGAADIAEVVTEVRGKLPGLEPPPTLPPEQARFRLFDSITTFLKNAAQSRPLMLVLDDLRWADKPSLLLLQFLARQLEESHLLVVGCYRDLELSPQHPLSETLAQLSRLPVFQRELLLGMSQEEAVSSSS